MILGDILRKNARRESFGAKTALIFGDRAWTYAELNAYANRIANALLALGVAKGDRVATLGGNSDPYVALHFALPNYPTSVSHSYRTLLGLALRSLTMGEPQGLQRVAASTVISRCAGTTRAPSLLEIIPTRLA